MVTRKLVALAAGVTVSLLTAHATLAEAAPVAPKSIIAVAPAVDAARLRAEIVGYVRELNEQMRMRISEDLRRELTPKVVSGNAPTTRS
jgi:hypothetical protein